MKGTTLGSDLIQDPFLGQGVLIVDDREVDTRTWRDVQSCFLDVIGSAVHVGLSDALFQHIQDLAGTQQVMRQF